MNSIAVVDEIIRHSISYDEIASLHPRTREDYEAIFDRLDARSEGSLATGCGYTDFRGKDARGNEWRVYLYEVEEAAEEDYEEEDA